MCGNDRTDDVAEESQTPSRDRLGDRRLSGTDANLLVGDVSGEGNLQNVLKAPLISIPTRLNVDFIGRQNRPTSLIV